MKATYQASGAALPTVEGPPVVTPVVAAEQLIVPLRREAGGLVGHLAVIVYLWDTVGSVSVRANSLALSLSLSLSLFLCFFLSHFCT